MFTLLSWLVVGYIAGSIALWLVPAKAEVPGWQTIAYGVAGSVVGGMANAMMSGDPYAPAGLVWSGLGAMVVVLGVRWYESQPDQEGPDA